MTNLRIASEWAQVVIDQWRDRMHAMGVHDPYSNGKNFAHFIYASAGGDVSKIEFAYQYYLKFTDMGVGKGAKLGQPGNRKQKPWSANFLLEVKKLANMLALSQAQQATLTIVQNISDNSNQ